MKDFLPFKINNNNRHCGIPGPREPVAGVDHLAVTTRYQIHPLISAPGHALRLACNHILHKKLKLILNY